MEEPGKLVFKFLPDYAQFLLTNKLEEFIAEQIRLSHEVKIPLLKYFVSFTDQELLELARKSNTEFLTALIENKMEDHLSISMKNWKDNRLPLITRDQISAEDITLASFIRKKTLLKFLPDYTVDPVEIIDLIKELDEYILHSDSKSIQLYFDIQQEKLQKSEERYHKMIDEVQDYAILLLGPDGEIQNWNKGAQKIKGYKAEEIIGKNFRIFYSEEDRKAQVPERLIRTARENDKASAEGWRVRKDGSVFWGSIVITALHDETNQVIGFTKVTRDLTERKSAEDKLLNYAMQLDKKNKELEITNKELTSFSYVASHDLQEPLRKIQTFGNRILEKEFQNLSETGQDTFKRMISASARMQKLIEDLLAFSRTHTHSQNFEPVDLNVILAAVESLQKEVIEEKKVTIESDKLPVISGITFQMQQLFENLIGNSIKYCDPKVSPHIRITSEIITGDKMQEHADAGNKKYYRISITDNGIGFDQKHADKIFEIFQRLHGKSQYPGTGIGLAICKKIVENHHGFIDAESKEDDGATFNIYLPV